MQDIITGNFAFIRSYIVNDFINKLVKGLNESYVDDKDHTEELLNDICLSTEYEASWIHVENGRITCQSNGNNYVDLRDFRIKNKDKKIFWIYDMGPKYYIAIPESELEDEKIQDILSGELNAQE